PPEARRLVQAMAPQPWPSDRTAALAALDHLPFNGPATAIWLSDGVEGGPSLALAEKLKGLGSLRVYGEAAEERRLLQLPPRPEAASLVLRLRRADSGGPRTVTVRATGEDGSLIAREDVSFEPGKPAVDHALAVPAELRNRVARLAIDGQGSVGSIVLID